jgi:hypothetical protein
LRLPLKKKLSFLADLPAHIVLFRGHLARLTTAGQAPLEPRCVQTDVPGVSVLFPRFPPVYFIVYGDQRGNWTADVRGLCCLRLGPAYQHPRPLHPSTICGAHRRVRGRSERGCWDGRGPSLPDPPHTLLHSIPYCKRHAPLLPATPTISSPTNFYPPPPGLGFNSYPNPMANGFYPYPPAPAPAPSDKKGNRQQGKKGQTPPKEKTGTPNNTLPHTSMSRPSKLHFYCHYHGWVITHGWTFGHGGHHGDACQFMKLSVNQSGEVGLAQAQSR